MLSSQICKEESCLTPMKTSAVCSHGEKLPVSAAVIHDRESERGHAGSFQVMQAQGMQTQGMQMQAGPRWSVQVSTWLVRSKHL